MCPGTEFWLGDEHEKSVVLDGKARGYTSAATSTVVLHYFALLSVCRTTYSYDVRSAPRYHCSKNTSCTPPSVEVQYGTSDVDAKCLRFTIGKSRHDLLSFFLCIFVREVKYPGLLTESTGQERIYYGSYRTGQVRISC